MKRLVSVILIIVVCASSLSAQKRTMSNIRKQKQTTQKAIEETSSKIKSNLSETEKSLKTLGYISTEIEDRQRAISSLSSQLVAIQTTLQVTTDSIELITTHLASLRSEYAKAVRKMHAHSSSFDKLIFLFSSSSFHQAYRRMRYLRQFSKWREKQSADIQNEMKHLEAQRTKIHTLQAQQSSNLARQNQTKLSLVQKQKEQGDIVASLKKEGSKLQTVLAEKKRKAQQLDQELDRLIAAEEQRAAERAKKEEERRIAKEKKAAESRRLADEQKRLEAERIAELKRRQEEAESTLKKDKKQPKKEIPVKKPTPLKEEKVAAKQNSGYQMSEQERSLSGSFESNKGRLLFPVSGKYKIIKPFGRQRHPELKYVETDNGGIDIEASPGAVARAVFNGKVSAVFRQEGYNTVVMVRHGNYLTIYVNLSDIYVHSGETVKANQAIGKIYSDSEDNNRTVLHFEVRKEKTKLNPTQWVR